MIDLGGKTFRLSMHRIRGREKEFQEWLNNDFLLGLNFVRSRQEGGRGSRLSAFLPSIAQLRDFLVSEWYTAWLVSKKPEQVFRSFHFSGSAWLRQRTGKSVLLVSKPNTAYYFLLRLRTSKAYFSRQTEVQLKSSCGWYESGDRIHPGWNGGCEEPEFKDKPQGGITSTVTQDFRQGQAGSKAGL